MESIITIIGSLTLVNQLVTEFIKKNVYNKQTTLVAFITAQLIVWVCLYFKCFELDYVATIILGLGVGLASTVGFDKVKEVIEKLNFK